MWPLHPGGYQKICSGGPEKCPQDGRIALLKPLFWHAKHAQNVRAKFVPVCPSRREGAKADLLPLARYTAPALPLVVAMPASGVVTGWRRTENAAALVGAALRSVLLLPLSAFTLHRREQTRSPAAGPLRHARPGTVWRRSLERGLCTWSEAGRLGAPSVQRKGAYP